MPEPTLRPREAPAAQPTAPVATGARPGAEADPKAQGGESETLRTLRELNKKFEDADKRNRDKDAHITKLQQELAAARKAAEPRQPDPHAERLDKALGDLDGGAIGAVIEEVAARKAQEIVQGMAPRILGAQEAERNARDGFGRLEALGVKDVDGRALGEAVRGLPPDAAYIGKLMAEGKRAEALALLQKAEESEAGTRRQAELLRLLTDRSPEARAKLRNEYLDIPSGSPGKPGETGYREGEGANLMFEMSLAPHARAVKDLDQWVGDEDFIAGRQNS